MGEGAEASAEVEAVRDGAAQGGVQCGRMSGAQTEGLG